MYRNLCALSIWLPILLITRVFAQDADYELDDYCLIFETRQLGQCKLASRCDDLLKNLQAGQVPIANCGFHGDQPMVCCPTSDDGFDFKIGDDSSEDDNSTVGLLSLAQCLRNSKYVKRPTAAERFCDITGAPEYGMQKAEEKEFPHEAFIGYDSGNKIKWLCSGTLISEQYVLTAGHCLSSPAFGPAKYIRLGVIDLENSNHQQDFNVSQIIKHPEYNQITGYNNIGLIKLDKRINVTRYVRPACLQQKFSYLPLMGSVLKIDHNASSWERFKFGVNIIPSVDCTETFAHLGKTFDNGTHGNTQMCANATTVQENAPDCESARYVSLSILGYGSIKKWLYCTYEIAGIASFGSPCKTMETPVIYTRVSAYLKWIEETVWPTQSV